uniref:Uncharacterized protein n=1 Tax=Picea glauca TaxID=3330 RepID=A0A101M4K0_PICGL|nr:hypothetical protein ABT39_MTgene812 [Picea glauca]QHR90552.1 hypothetical protein Q903MT_gene4577 [Picea sitchensis]
MLANAHHFLVQKVQPRVLNELNNLSITRYRSHFDVIGLDASFFLAFHAIHH